VPALSSEIEKLARAIRTVGDGAGPVSQALDRARLSAQRLSSAVPRTESAGAAAGALYSAAGFCTEASRSLASFSNGCQAFADRLASGGGGSGSGSGTGGGEAGGPGPDAASAGNSPTNTALVTALQREGLELGAVSDFDYADNPVLEYGKAPPEDIAYAVQTWNERIAPGIAEGRTREDFEAWDQANGLTGHQRLAGVYDYFLGDDAIWSGGRTAGGGLDVGGGRHRLDQAKALGVKYLPFRRH
jgi:hypothetical protein